ncbi:MAG: BLUF domain-containing protein [Chitinophagaceae bacterium]|nr:BLUF domain-containing protein [Chitinophagaceae bacterium]
MEKSSDIYHLSYVSTGCDCIRFEDIKDILEIARKNNEDDQITGILVYCNKHFFQILEGEKEAIIELFNKISIDRRHDNVIKIQEGYIEQRHFDKWNMAFKSFNKELRDLDNFNTEQFYSYINRQLENDQTGNGISLKILADFFDLNG